MEGTFIGVAALENIAVKYRDEIVMGGVYFRDDVFERMQIDVLSGVRYKDVQTIMNRKGHTTKRKVVGEKLNSTLGALEERPMVGHLSWNHYLDNQDNYIEKAIAKNVDGTISYSYPLSELAFKAAVAGYGEDVFDCLWFGDDELTGKEENGYLHLYTGFITYLQRDITRGRISKTNKNLVHVETVSAPVDATDIDAWNVFKSFRSQWSQNLKNAKLVLIYCNDLTAQSLREAYENSKNNNNGVIDLENGNFRFREWKNIEICGESSMGTGDKMIATTPLNFQYGVNTLDSRTRVSVRLGTDNDHNDITFQVQSVQGTRVVNVNPSNFCMTDAPLTPVSASGDYIKATYAVNVNSGAMGSVTVNGSSPKNDEDYPAGTILALVAKPQPSHHFVRWSNGQTNPNINVVTPGYPEAITALFAHD